MHSSAQETLTIAFASSDSSLVDAHFGSSPSLMIYSVTPTTNEHIKTVELPHYEGHNPQKIADRLNALTDCFAVYCLACGNPVRQQLLAQGTRVVISAQETPIASLISDLQSHWPGEIARRQARQIDRKKESDYFDKLADSAWDE